jgi:hypothetical protein
MTQPLAKIYQPAKTAMQSGRAKTKYWVLEYKPVTPKTPDPLMGWNSASDTLYQVKLRFDTQEEAEGYAKAKNIAYEVIVPHAVSTGPKAYAANFAANRRRAYAGNV